MRMLTLLGLALDALTAQVPVAELHEAEHGEIEPRLVQGLGSILFLPYEGKKVPEFDSLVFSSATELGTIHLVTTEFGTHLVKVDERG